jgi:hypothetical protein
MRVHLFYAKIPKIPTRETREGWPLQTVETEVNGDSKSTNEREYSVLYPENFVVKCITICICQHRKHHICKRHYETTIVTSWRRFLFSCYPD